MAAFDKTEVLAAIGQLRQAFKELEDFKRKFDAFKSEAESMTHQVTVRRHKHSWQTRMRPLVIKNSTGQYLLSVEVNSDGMSASWRSLDGSQNARFGLSAAETARKVASLVGGEVVNQLESEPEPAHSDDESEDE